MLPAQYAEQGLCNGLESVRPSVCPIDQPQQRRSAGLLLSALRVGDIDQQLRAPHSAGNVDSVTLRADGGGSTFFTMLHCGPLCGCMQSNVANDARYH